MRRTAPMRWLEAAEARRVFLVDAETKPPPAENGGGQEFPLVTKATLTVLVARMTGRLARAARAQPAAGANDEPADGCDDTAPSWIAIGCGGAPYRIARAASAGAVPSVYAPSYSRETSLLV